jgi:hypothetical protein
LFAPIVVPLLFVVYDLAVAVAVNLFCWLLAVVLLFVVG